MIRPAWALYADAGLWPAVVGCDDDGNPAAVCCPVCDLEYRTRPAGPGFELPPHGGLYRAAVCAGSHMPVPPIPGGAPVRPPDGAPPAPPEPNQKDPHVRFCP